MLKSAFLWMVKNIPLCKNALGTNQEAEQAVVNGLGSGFALRKM